MTERGQLVAHDAGHSPADARIDLVENKGLARHAVLGAECLEGQHDPRQLTTRDDAGQGPELFTDVR